MSWFVHDVGKLLLVLLTIRLSDALCVSVPEVPVIVSGYVPAVVPEVVVMVITDIPELVSAGGVKVAVAPLGSPDTLKFTMPLNPFNELTRALGYPTLPPPATEMLVGVTEKPKSGGLFVFTVTLSNVAVVTELLAELTANPT